MPFFAADSVIFAPQFSDPELSEIFSDEQFVALMLQVEAALARVEGKAGLIPKEAAANISTKAATLSVDLVQLQADTEKAGVPVIGLVKQLKQHVGPEAADFVHWGATTQDIMDTAVVLQTKAALSLIEKKLVVLISHLVKLADDHRQTLMVGRTHSQQALPTTFGLKAAAWLAPLLRHWQRLDELKPRLLVVQFGGAAGTLAALDHSGTAVQKALASELKLGTSLLPWHTQRDTLAELAGWLSLLSGSLAKMAQDIILMAQTEVAELRETDDHSRGGSSTMPQKSNPIISELIIAAARSNASLLASMHQALIQEHERATHGWQLEWLTLPQMFALTTTAVNKARFLSQHLVVNAEQMQENVQKANGLILAEALSFALAAHMSRTAAKKLVGAACQTAVAEKRNLVDVVREQTGLPLNWDELKDESNYLGATAVFIDQVLQAAAEITMKDHP